MKPSIKFNGGNPVALCIKCNVISCYVTFDEERDYVFKASTQHTIDGVNRGDIIPNFCRECIGKELMVEKV